MSAQSKSAYRDAGVDIDLKTKSLTDVKRLILGTNTPGVLSKPGAFGGMFVSPGASSVLVASTDGVGTKLKVAVMAGRHDTVGQDLVNHCVNDILVQGAKPLFFLDYVGTARLSGPVFKDVLKGICKACRENGCALLGGETAEMPGLYPDGEYDLVGTIVGSVDKDKIVDGAEVCEGDAVIGLHCAGLQTNGFSLARRIVFNTVGLKINDCFPGSSRTVADTLLEVHRSFLKPVSAVMEAIRVRGMAHITGGGLIDNVPRSLPAGLSAEIQIGAWTPPPIFRFLQERGDVDAAEMFRVFNMGIGYVLIVRERDSGSALEALASARCRATRIGRIVGGRGGVILSGL